MTKLCPVCGERAITKPELRRCNVCWAEEHRYDNSLAAHRQTAMRAMQHAARREEVKQRTLTLLRDAALGRFAGDLPALLDRAATIIEGGVDLIIEQEDAPAVVRVEDVQFDARVGVITTGRVREPIAHDDEKLIILHGE